MHKISNKTISEALKPFDLVSSGCAIGMVRFTSFNDCQDDPAHQVSYSVAWLFGGENLKSSWFDQDELKFLGKNIMVEVAKCMSPASMRTDYIERQFGNDQLSKEHEG